MDLLRTPEDRFAGLTGFDHEPRRAVVTAPDGAKLSRPLPTLGADPFDPKVHHLMEIRAESGRAEARLDGVLLPGAWSVPGPDARLGLFASGVADFDAVAITNATDPGRL